MICSASARHFHDMILFQLAELVWFAHTTLNSFEKEWVNGLRLQEVTVDSLYNELVTR